MLRAASFATIYMIASAARPALAQVQTIGDVSFAVPDGWRYQQGRDFGSMTLKPDNRFWVVAVYTPMPSTGNPNADFRAAWQRVVLAGTDYRGVPRYDPYNITATAGYPGKYYDDSSVDKTTYTRLYVLETGKSCIPVAFVSLNRQTLDAMEHNAFAIVGSVRLAPLRASPIRYVIHVSDLAGHWTSGIVTSTDYYSSSGQYKTNSLTAIRAEYSIDAGGSYIYKASGLLNNRPTTDDDTGVIQLGGDFITFKGQRRVTQNRFINLQQMLDGSTVMTLWPPVDIAKISPSRDATYWTRLAK